jgi:hypothetical protein
MVKDAPGASRSAEVNVCCPSRRGTVGGTGTFPRQTETAAGIPAAVLRPRRRPRPARSRPPFATPLVANLDKASLPDRKAKTDADVRRVALPAMAVTALWEHRKAQRQERMAAQGAGEPGAGIHYRDRYRAYPPDRGTGGRTCAPLPRWDDAGSTPAATPAATLMLNNGVPLEVVSATLGHAGFAITSNVYARVRPELQRTAAAAMHGAFGQEMAGCPVHSPPVFRCQPIRSGIASVPSGPSGHD